MSAIHARFRLDRGDFTLDVDLNLPGRGVTALFGPSGSGKTSLLRLIAGLDRAQDGELSVNGQVWQDAGSFLPIHRRPLGYVFQEASLFPHLSIRRNLEFGMKRVGASDRRVSLDQAIELLGIGHLLDRKPDSLSGGERQRVALARAFAAQPDLLLLDEPFSNLDRLVRTELLEALRTVLDDTHTTSILVTHDVRDAVDFGSDLLLIAEGRVQRQGSIAQVLADPGSDWTRRFLACGLGQATHQEPRHENS